MIRASIVISLGLALLGCDSAPPPELEPATPPSQPPPPPPRAAETLDEYASLCGAGEPYPAAKRYAKGATPADISRVAVFEKYPDAAAPAWRHVTSPPLEGWSAKEPADVQLVACVEVSKRQLRRSCSFADGQGGSYQLDLHDMSHAVRVVEAATGEVVLAQTFELPSLESCPTLETFGSNSAFRGTDYKQKLLALLLPLEPEGVAVPAPHYPFELDQVCAGVPFPGTARYDKSAAQKHPLFATYRPDEAAPFSMDNVPANFHGDGDAVEDPSAYQLVACVTGKPEKKRKVCRFQGGLVLELYEGTVEVAVYASATAERLETRTFRATRGECPLLFNFPAGASRATTLGQIEPAYRKYLASLVGP